MHPALAPPRHQPRPLQGQLHPGVAELDPMFAVQLLVKMPHVQIEIPVAVQSKHLLHHRHRHPFRRGLALSPVEQSVVAELLIPLSPAPHRPIAQTENLGRLPPRDLLRNGSQNHFLYFHRPLHCGLPVTDHAWHGLLPSPPAKRTDHLLSQPDTSCANDSVRYCTWKSLVRGLQFRWLRTIKSQFPGVRVRKEHSKEHL